MKSNVLKIAAVAMIVGLPATLLAQQSTREKDKDKERKEVQVITITRTGEKDDKTVVEINGDKVKVNGKDVADLKDVKVKVTTRPTTHVWIQGEGDGFNFNGFGNGLSLFSEDANRAMLGVVTEGKDKGAEVLSITKESAAEKAGLKKGDVITKVDNKKIETPDDLTDAIRDHKPGDKVNVTVLRDGKEQKLAAELGKYKGIPMTSVTMPRIADELRELRNFNINMSPETPRAPSMVYAFGGGPRLGVSIQDTEDGKGVKVLEVDEDSNAAKAGIKEGDVITQLDGQAVTTVDEVQRTLREKRTAASVKLQLLRDGKTQNAEIKFPKKLKTVDL